MKLKLYRGCPGAGKSTLARKENNCLILENDQFMYENGKYVWSPDKVKRAIAIVKSMAETALANNSDVVIANTFTRRGFVDSYRRLAEKYGAEFEVIRCTADYGNVHNVPKNVLDGMRNHFDDWPGERIV